jgi:hypothetical protein
MDLGQLTKKVKDFYVCSVHMVSFLMNLDMLTGTNGIMKVRKTHKQQLKDIAKRPL